MYYLVLLFFATKLQSTDVTFSATHCIHHKAQRMFEQMFLSRVGCGALSVMNCSNERLTYFWNGVIGHSPRVVMGDLYVFNTELNMHSPAQQRRFDPEN